MLELCALDVEILEILILRVITNGIERNRCIKANNTKLYYLCAFLSLVKVVRNKVLVDYLSNLKYNFRENTRESAVQRRNLIELLESE